PGENDDVSTQSTQRSPRIPWVFSCGLRGATPDGGTMMILARVGFLAAVAIMTAVLPVSTRARHAMFSAARTEAAVPMTGFSARSAVSALIVGAGQQPGAQRAENPN